MIERKVFVANGRFFQINGSLFSRTKAFLSEPYLWLMNRTYFSNYRTKGCPKQAPLQKEHSEALPLRRNIFYGD